MCSSTSFMSSVTGNSGALDLNVGFFPSVPWIPNYGDRATWPVNLVRCESSGVRGLIERGQLDVTPMAIPDWFELEGRWKRLANWGISFRGLAGSVVFFSNEPMSQLDGADIDVCYETTTSVRVLQAIMKKKYGLRIGRWSRNLDVDNGTTPRLLIQDQAVEERKRGRFRYEYDLGREWFGWIGTPIVSAVWAYRADLDPSTVAVLEGLLKASMVRYRMDPLTAIGARHAEHGLPASIEEIKVLHQNFEYALSDEAELGITRMRELLEPRIEGFEARQEAAIPL